VDVEELMLLLFPTQNISRPFCKNSSKPCNYTINKACNAFTLFCQLQSYYKTVSPKWS